ncbi:MAG: undecaprenyl-phosphate galactose phosphotransferase WbaP [Nitrospirae bacterium]|nr:undecaprenyl-phosphate galactose phosphotransferase WbaP [Nitrospirota bacterium]
MKHREHYNWFRSQAEILLIFSLDLISILLLFLLSRVIRTDILPLIYTGFPVDHPFDNPMYIVLVCLIWIFFLCYEGLYTRIFSYWDEVRILWRVSFLSTIGIFTIASAGKIGDEISRTVVILMGIIAIVLLPLIRMKFKKTLRRFGFLKRRVLILGAGKTGRLMLKALMREPNYGYNIIGFLDDDPEKCGKRIEGIKIHRGVDKALNYINQCNIEDVFIAMPGVGKEKLQTLINKLQHKVKNILFVPDIFGIAVLGTNLRHFFYEEAFAFEMNSNLYRPVNILLKKCFDMVISALLLPLLFFPMLVLIALIRLDSIGPAVFFQERIGKNGRKFRCYKFRTMYADAEERLKVLLENDPARKKEWTTFWKLKDDPRITRIGKFLRKTSLDELPQIFNVLKGEMSLVGPRPYLPSEWEFIESISDSIHNVAPGITGLWQVNGRSNSGHEFRIMLDLWYVRNWNLWLDVIILLKTVRIVLTRQGAY